MRVFLLFLFITIIAQASCTFDDSQYVQNGLPSVVLINDEYAYTANGELGIDIINLTTMETVNKILPPREMHSIDGMSISDDLLFVIDGRGENYLAVYSLDDPIRPKLASGPIGVRGQPFNAVSAASGNVVVSGGTHRMSYRKYDSSGKLSSNEAIFARGDRGHPDVLLSNDGKVAFVSTDFTGTVDGASFGMLSLQLDDLATSPQLVSQIGIPGAGFTGTTTRPNGFPLKSALFGNQLLVANETGLSIIEIRGGTNLSSINTLNVGMTPTNIAVHQNTAFIIGMGSVPTLVKVDLSDIQNPVITETTTLNTSGGLPTSIAVNDDFILIAANEGGLIILPN